MSSRYGMELHLLQESPQNEENLTQLIHLSHSLRRHTNCRTFQGFDWFIATVFLLCGGNMERCVFMTLSFIVHVFIDTSFINLLLISEVWCGINI
jgi:hypothetical protein